jgi:hypothetical protein
MSHTFNVEMVEEHDDGSATFTVSGDKASMHSLFEAFFTQALINGIEHAVESKGPGLQRESCLMPLLNSTRPSGPGKSLTALIGRTSNAFMRSLMRPLRRTRNANYL